MLDNIRMKRKMAILLETMGNNKTALAELFKEINGADDVDYEEAFPTVNVNFDVQGGSIRVNSGEVNEDDEPLLEFEMDPATGDITEIMRAEDGSMEQTVHVTVDPAELNIEAAAEADEE